MRFRDWLRGSNEAKPFRDAFELIDQMPIEHGLKKSCFEQVEARTKTAWAQTKKDLEL